MSFTPISLPIFEIDLFQGVVSTTNTTYTRIAGRDIPVDWPATIDGLTRVVSFFANIETSAAAAQANIRLYNVSDAEIVSGTVLESTSTSTVLVGGVVTVGASPNNLKLGDNYEIQIARSGGAGGDQAICTSARLSISYE